jgi:NADH dehydrogenase FAD-containing subunit
MSTMVEEVKEETDQLNAHDRCDRCSSQAYVWINGVNGDLLFCGHHFAKNEEKLRAYAFEIIDERHKLEVKRESSANS